MKMNKFLTYAIASALTLTAGSMMTGCTDSFEDLNTNKYEVDPDNLPFESQFVEPITYVYAPQQNMFQYCTNLSTD